MSPVLTVREACRIARAMSWKWVTADIFFGGAKAGIQFKLFFATPRGGVEGVGALWRHIPDELPQ